MKWNGARGELGELGELGIGSLTLAYGNAWNTGGWGCIPTACIKVGGIGYRHFDDHSAALRVHLHTGLHTSHPQRDGHHPNSHSLASETRETPGTPGTRETLGTIGAPEGFDVRAKCCRWLWFSGLHPLHTEGMSLPAGGKAYPPGPSLKKPTPNPSLKGREFMKHVKHLKHLEHLEHAEDSKNAVTTIISKNSGQR